MSERRDVIRNRARLVAAAEEVFAGTGPTAPLDLVARRAGVGRGTLYRHFPDRESLIAAVYSTRMDLLEELAAGLPDEERWERLLAAICALQLESPGLLGVMQRSDRGRTRLDDISRRTTLLLLGALSAAQRCGAVRADASARDLYLTLSMVEGVIAHAPPDAAHDSVARALELVLTAMRGERRAGAPLPEVVDPRPDRTT
ncbi:TetR family transcriptional regulator [Actinomycetota bacterium]|nr:TetR family transcriptional regulator [Actinomycetota bacterium]